MKELRLMVKRYNELLKTADHLTYVTYPLVKDVKLLVAIIGNLYESVKLSIESLLYFERMYKRIGPLPDNFNSKLDVFKSKIVDRFNFDRKFLVLVEDLKNIVEHREKSPMEFIRRDRYVICNHNYRMKTLTIENIKNYLAQSKLFVAKINAILNQNDRRF